MRGRHDGQVRSEGIRHITAETAERIARGEEVSPKDYYFRTAMRFATASQRLEWLNHLLAISHGERLRSAVLLSVHAVR